MLSSFTKILSYILHCEQNIYSSKCTYLCPIPLFPNHTARILSSAEQTGDHHPENLLNILPVLGALFVSL